MRNLSNFEIAPWVAHRSYFVGTVNSRTIISNEMLREYFLLDGVSSDIISAIARMDLELYNRSIEAIGDDSCVAGFIDDVLSAGIILNKDSTKCSTKYKNSSEPPLGGNQSRDFEREMMVWANRNNFLFSAHWEMTYSCNMRCCHCYNPKNTGDENFPKRKKFSPHIDKCVNIIDQLESIGVFRLTFSGGEPTLDKNFIQSLRYARSRGFSCVVYTNCLGLNDKAICEISNLYPHGVEVSIYGATPSMHDNITGINGSFSKLMSAIDKFTKNGIRVTMKATIMEKNADGWRSIVKLSNDMGLPLIFNASISPTIDGNTHPLDLSADFRKLVAMFSDSGSPISIGNLASDRRNIQSPSGNSNVCGAGRFTLSISPDGGIYPCTAIPVPVGTVNSEHGIIDTWRASENKGEDHLGMEVTNLNSWRFLELSKLKECRKYDYCEWCDDMCPGDAMVLTGDPLLAPNNKCVYAKARMEAASMLADGMSYQDILDKIGINISFGNS